MTAGSWLPRPPRRSAGVRLFCLPHSGGGASLFKDWAGDLPGWIDAVPVSLPGRDERAGEAALDSMAELASAVGDALRPHLDEPFALFGHSMGALLAYEVARRFASEGGPAPVALIVAGMEPPHRLPPSRLHTLPDEELLAELAALGGIPEQLRQETELLSAALPTLRADTTVVGTYRHRPEPRLGCPVVALSGSDDPLGGPAAMTAWDELTDPPVTVREFPGGHFFVTEHRREVTRTITAELRRNLPRSTGGERTAPPPAPKTAVAVVGIGCRFPGGDGPEEFWRALVDGVDAVTDVPADRTEHPEVFGSLPDAGTDTRQGGFLDDVRGFDAAFFGISPREADRMDPQQRLLLETAWEALEDARIPPDALAGSRTGVFMGQMGRDYWELQGRHSPLDLHSLTGGGLSAFTSGRISFALDLRGPSLSLDSACSSSLAAVHMACQSLRYGDSDLALAGGVNLVLLPELAGVYEQVGLMSREGRCRFGDVSADGFVRSDGAGVVVLKPLAQARADGDRVYAVIMGGAANNDGAGTGSLVAPAQDSQEGLLRRALDGAGVAASDVGYVEAHGTGTRMGDAVELSALAEVFGEGRAAGRPCLVGSVKSNIGHPEGAAGVAGFIKTVLSLHHGLIPGNPLLTEPQPMLTEADAPLRVPCETVPWPEGTPPLAGVTSFGLSGTNVHLVLAAGEQAPTTLADTGRPLVLPVSGREPAAVNALLAAYADRLDGADRAEAARVCAVAARGRSHHRWRAAAAAQDGSGLAAALRDRMGEEAESGRVPRLVFVFPGHGSQWAGMGRDLLQASPAFRDTIEECEALIKAEAGWSLLEALESSALERTPVIQPALWAVEVSLAAHWRSWGVRPDAVIGHSFGEVAAAHVAGALTLAGAARLICRRGEVTQRADGRGAMAAVALPEPDAAEIVARFDGRLVVAAVNGPRSTVLSGDTGAVTEVLAELERAGVRAGRVRINYASHSPHMTPLQPVLRAALDDLVPGPERVSFRSTVTGEHVAGSALDTGYWVEHLRRPVRFADAVSAEAAAGPAVFLEISPHPVLLPAIRQCLAGVGEGHAALATLHRERPGPSDLAEAVAGLYTAGADIDWSVHHPPPEPVEGVPTYQWQRRDAWFPLSGRAPQAYVPAAVEAPPVTAAPSTGGGDLLTELTEELGAVLALPGHRVSRRRPLNAVGCDSLMAIEVRDRVERRWGVRLSPSTLLGATAEEIAAELAAD